MKDKTALAKNGIALFALALVFAAAGVLHRAGNGDVIEPVRVAADEDGEADAGESENAR